MNVLYSQHKQLWFPLLAADLNAARESKFLKLFGISSHILRVKNAIDPVPYLIVLTRLEENVLLFRVLYTEFRFNRKASFMRIGEKLFKILYSSIARDCELL